MVPSNSRPRRVLLLVICATLLIFGGLIALITSQLRAQLRTEVLRREAEAIDSSIAQLARGTSPIIVGP